MMLLATSAFAGSGRPAALAAFVGYLVVVLALGVYAARFSSSGMSEFFIGGRRLSRFVVALSAVVSGRSAWLLLGFGGMAWQYGAKAIWAVLGYIVVEGALFLSFAVRLRRFSEVHDCITVPDFLAARFRDDRGVLRSISVLFILVFLVTYVAAQFVSGGKTLAPSFGMSESAAVLVTAGIVLVYTALGGFLAVSLTDLVQAFVMLFGLVVVPIVVMSHLGGWTAVIDELTRIDEGLLSPFAAGSLVGLLAIGLGSPGQPHIMARYMAIRDASQLRAAALIGTVWNTLMAAGALTIGLLGRASFATKAALPGGDPETIYLVLAERHLHPILFGVVIASVFAAIMSTADSQILVCASSVVRDLYQKVIRRDEELSPRALVRGSRVVVVGLVLVAIALGFVATKVVFWLVLLAWDGLGAALGPVSILGLYWRRVTRSGAIAGMLAGVVVTIGWRLVPGLQERLYPLIPGFAAGLFVTVVTSLATRPPPDVDRMFDSMRRQGP